MLELTLRHSHDALASISTSKSNIVPIVALGVGLEQMFNANVA